MLEITQSGRLKELEVSSLKSEGYSEKQLQEWFAEYPNIFGTSFYGEEYADHRKGVEKSWKPYQQRLLPSLLIIQQEYRFDINGVQRSIDLLALDMDYRLVLIELKAGPAKRDIVSQVVSYRLHLRNLDTNQIIEIYQEYLDEWWPGEYNAEEEIRKFLEPYYGNWDKENEHLNKDQVILLVAEKFDGEVFDTAKASFDGDNDACISCYNIGIYSDGNKKFLTCNQVLFKEKNSRQENNQSE